MVKAYIRGGGRRLAVKASDWIPDWYVGWSPRNENYSAEGTWDDWVHLATAILAEEEHRQKLADAV